jgi:hypothetical protein
MHASASVSPAMVRVVDEIIAVCVRRFALDCSSDHVVDWKPR